MLKATRMQYCIKSCPSEDTQALENLLNQMSLQGWEIYTMHEVESGESYAFNCIFARETEVQIQEEDTNELDDIFGTNSGLHKMISSNNEPFEMCVEIQRKIKDKRARVNKIKTLIDETSEGQRQKLNKEMSVCMEELASLRKELQRVISPDIMSNKIGEDKITIKLSEENTALVNPDLDANLVAHTVKTRQKLAEELGYILPKIKFENDETLQANEFAIEIRGVNAFKGCVYPGCLLFFKDDLNLSKPYKAEIKDNDFVTGKPVIWLPQEKTTSFWVKGLSAPEVIARVLEYVCIKHAGELFDYSDISRYIEIVGENNLYLIENIIPDFVSVAELKFILTNLIKERVSVKDIVFIFEKINDFAEEETKEDLLSKVRHSLGRQISKSIANENNQIQAFELSDESLKYFIGKLKGKSAVIRIDNTKIKSIVQNLKKSSVAQEIVLIVPMELRQVISTVFSQVLANIKVVASEEIASGYSVEIIDRV